MNFFCINDLQNDRDQEQDPDDENAHVSHRNNDEGAVKTE